MPLTGQGPARGSSLRGSLGVLGLYGLVSFGYFGLRVLPHPGRDYIGSGRDPEIFIWSLAWWPHALLHGQNPFVSHAVWAPAGVNLTWTTSIPGLAVLLSPITIAFGPVVAYNVAAVAIPALAAFTAYLLCRRLTGSLWPALAGGYLFGFSSYVLGQELGHMHVSAVFLLPLVPLLILRYLDSELTRRGLVLRLGPVLAAQLYISTEVGFSLALAIAGALLVAAATRARRGLWPAAGAIAWAYGFAAVLASPLLVYALLDFHSGSINPPAGWEADAANFLVPTDITLVGNHWSMNYAKHFAGNDLERGAYLGLPTLIIIAWFAVLYRRRPSARFLLAMLALAVVCAFGTAFVWQGRARITLPWSKLTTLPVFDNVLTTRFTVYSALLAAVIVSLWLASSRVAVAARIVLGALALLAIVPRASQGMWYTHPRQPAFFADGLVGRCLASGETAMVLPYTSNGDSMLWQAESGFRFAMAGGHVQPNPPPAFEKYPAVAWLDEDTAPPKGAADVRVFARAVHLSVILVDDTVADRWRSLLAPLARPIEYGGVRIYRLSGTTPATCGPTPG